MSWTRRIVASVFAAGLASAGVVAAPGAATAAPNPAHHGRHHGHHHGHHCYQAAVQANPSVTVHKSGHGAVAVVGVSQHLSGRAWLDVRPGHSAAVPVKNGWGHRYFSTKKSGTYTVTVSFPSSKDGCVVGGSASTTYSVGGSHHGDSGSQGQSTAAGGGKGTTSAKFVNASSGLTQQSSGDGVSTALLGALGVGLLGAGTVSIAVTRRRGRAGSAQS